MFEIVEYTQEYEKETNDLVISIFVEEYGFEHYRDAYKKAKHHKYKENSGNCWLAINEKGEVIGVSALENVGNNIGKLNTMYVKKEYRGNGIAQKLYDTLYDFAVKKQYKRIILGTYERLDRAINFYKKNGFVEYSHPKYTIDDKYFYLDINKKYLSE